MRLLSLHPFATELVFALGAGHLLVGRTDGCSYPDAAISLPSIGQPDAITPDAVAVFEPDVVMFGPGQERLAILLQERYRVLTIAPQSLDDVFASFVSIGESLSKQVEADMLVHELHAFFERVKERTMQFHQVKVYCEGVPYLRDLVTLCGGIPYDGSGELQSVIDFGPQAIVVVSAADPDDEAQKVTGRGGWSQLQAVRHERVFVVDEALFRPTPRIAQGAKLLAKLLHGVTVNGS